MPLSYSSQLKILNLRSLKVHLKEDIQQTGRQPGTQRSPGNVVLQVFSIFIATEGLKIDDIIYTECTKAVFKNAEDKHSGTVNI